MPAIILCTGSGGKVTGTRSTVARPPDSSKADQKGSPWRRFTITGSSSGSSMPNRDRKSSGGIVSEIENAGP